MTYRLGVDLGTTFTAAAVANGGPPTMLGLGNRMLQVPSVLYLPSEGGLVVGEAAERRGATDPGRVVREFKRRIGDHVPMLVAGVPYSPQALTARLLHWVVEAATAQMGEPPAQVVLTYPANWGPYKRELLEQVVQLADVGDVVTCSEPEAAATQYAAKRQLRAGDTIAMYDLGGGTFDTCILQKQAEGFTLLGDPVGIEHLGGIDFDDAVFQHVVDSLGDRMLDLDTSDETVAAGVARLRRDCVDAKEALSSDTHAVVPVSLAGWSTTVRLTRSELEDLIRAPLEETVAAVGRAIRSAGLQPSDLSAIVLVGGGSRIPLVREMLQQEFQVTTAVDTHPKHDVALGAVQIPSGTFRLGAAASSPPAVSQPRAAAKQTPVASSPPAVSQSRPAAKAAAPSAPAAPPVPVVPPAPSSPRVKREPDDTAKLDPVATSQLPPVETDTPAAGFTIDSVFPPARPVTKEPAAPPEPVAVPVPAPVAVEPVGPVAPVIPPQLRPVTSRPTVEPPSAPPKPPKEPGNRRRALLIASGAVVAVVAIAGVVLALTQGGRDSPPSTSGPTTTATAVASGALPASKPLSADQMIIGMVVDDNLDLYLGDAGQAAPVRRLTTDPGSDYSPSLSPDRRTVIYVHEDKAGGARIPRVMAADGRGARDLFPTAVPQCASVFRPAWNPIDTSELALACIGADGTKGLYLVRTDGTVERPLDIGQPRVDDPAFSPDGKRVAYQAGKDSSLDGGAIYAIPVDGGKPKRLTNGKIGQDADPVWSIDGKRIAFRRRIDDGTKRGNFDIFVVPSDGSGAAKPLIQGEADDQDPSWSPDGSQLIFKSNRTTPGGKVGDTARIWVADSDGKKLRLLWTQEVTGNVQAASSWTRR